MIFHPMIGGGGASISVKAYASADELPTTAKDGDIAVISETPVGNVFAQSAEPSAAKNGDLWLTFTATGSLPVLSGSAVVYPKTAKQYNGSEWSSVPMFVFNNAKWNSTVLILLDKTNTADEITGGWNTFKWNPAKVTKTENGYLISGGNGGYAQAAIQTINKVDVTDYKKIVFKGNVVDHMTYGNPLFGLQTKVGSTQNEFIGGFSASVTTIAGEGEYVATLDISEYSGEYYITVVAGHVMEVSYVGLEE